MNKYNIALIGRTNVGKSTLFNRLIGKKKAIVSTIPGTTRDRINSEITINNQIYVLTDVGGFSDNQYEDFSEEIKEQFEKAFLSRQLELVGGKVTELARRVNMERTNLYRKLSSLNIDYKKKR